MDIWESYEQVPMLRVCFIGRLRATSLWTYTDTMHRFHNLAETAVTDNRNSLRGWKSEPMSDVEWAQLYLMDGGIELRPQYPICARCQHSYFDGPTDNATVHELKREKNGGCFTYKLVCYNLYLGYKFVSKCVQSYKSVCAIFYVTS